MSDNMADADDRGDAYDLDELLGAYALDAVDDDERARVEDYLSINPKAAEEVRQHREVATMLAFTMGSCAQNQNVANTSQPEKTEVQQTTNNSTANGRRTTAPECRPGSWARSARDPW